MVSRPPSPAIAAVAAPHGEGFHVPRVFEKCATGLAGPSLAKPESSNGDFLSPGERIKSEGERQHKLSFFILRHQSTPNCLWPHGWDFAGERARPGCRFRRRAENRFPN